jgi:monovalent cation:H+ antiporter, CPA1 family
MTAESALVLFLMLAISSVSVFIAQRLRVPHTVFLVLVGVGLAVLSMNPSLHFLQELKLTPELLFFFFLPTLIFESAYNINIRHLTQDALIISVLAIVSLVVSTFAIAFGLDFAFGFLSLEVPFMLSLIFGAIISATDPVAVLALFKEYGAPRRLSLIFEGESIFNDGTGVALFLVILAIAETGTFGASDVLHGTLSFIGMVLGGAVFGLLMGGFFAKLIGYTRGNEFASITLTMVLAHTTFIASELWNHYVSFNGTHVLLSSIIATAVASLLMGNYGRYKLPQHAHEFVEKYWSQFAFLANSLIFIMIGMLAVDLPAAAQELIIPIVLTILIVAGARALSVYPIVSLFNVFARKEKQVPTTWQHVLAWGSLRGALAVTMVLLIPDTLTFPGWTLGYTPKELILTLTVSCVFATLFIKATTIGGLMRHLKLSTFTRLEEINYREMLIYIYDATMKRLKESFEKGYLEKSIYERVAEEQQTRIRATLDELRTESHDPKILEKVIRLYAIGIERKHIKALYAHNEVTETVIKRVMDKLEYQTYAIEHDTFDPEAYEHGRTRDIFEYLADLLRTITFQQDSQEEIAMNDYLYYRALTIISRKVVKELGKLDSCFDSTWDASHEVVKTITAIYERYREGSLTKMYEVGSIYPTLVTSLNETLARRALYMRESDLLDSLREREMVTPKVSIMLGERLKSESEKVA